MPASRSGTREDKANLQARLQTLHAIEDGDNETAAIAELISIAVLRRHLETMDRLDIEYDFLPRESEILHLHFWDAAFTKLKEAGVLTYENEGKNKGCWVMRRAGTASNQRPGRTQRNPGDISEEDQKVIVRSNGTVGYVGKDIAYHMWKFGLLGRDFGYRKFYRYPNSHECWISTTEGEPDHPHFGDVAENLQRHRRPPVRGAEHGDRSLARTRPWRSRRSLHAFLLRDGRAHPALCRRTWLSAERRRQGALLHRGLRAQRLWRESRRSAGHAHRLGEKRSRLAPSAIKRSRTRSIATQIAIGALRYFMLKFTKQSVIAFDFKEALSFEGETGPYAQYAVVRATSIFRKAGFDPETFFSDAASQISAADLGNISSRRSRQRNLGAVAGCVKDLIHDRTVHCDYRAGVSGEACFPARAAFQYLLPPKSHSQRARRKAEAIPAGHGRRRPPRNDSMLAVMGITVPPVM